MMIPGNDNVDADFLPILGKIAAAPRTLPTPAFPV